LGLKDDEQQKTGAGQSRAAGSQQKPLKRSRIYLTGTIAVFCAGASAWLTHEAVLHCDSLAPLTVLATVSAFLISICFRQMGRFPDKRSRWTLLIFMLVAAGTLFTDFRYVRKYREFCDQLQQQMRQGSR
jgi:uncharacterized membrane protein YoaK (UPF0700 family)